MNGLRAVDKIVEGLLEERFDRGAGPALRLFGSTAVHRFAGLLVMRKHLHRTIIGASRKVVK